MSNVNLPTVDIDFFVKLVSQNSRIKIITYGSSTAYIIGGSKPIGQRIVIIRVIAGQVDFDFATGTAIKLKCMPDLLKWFEVNRKWKDGAYFV
jgi:hypothetical protein